MISLFFFFISLSLSSPSNPNCSSAFCSQCLENDPSVCTSCIDNCGLENGQCKSLSYFHCRKMRNNKCLSCESNYYLDFKSYRCIKGTENCIEMISNTNGFPICKQCKEGYMNTLYGCINCKIENPNCVEFGTSCNECKKCGRNTYLLDNKCIYNTYKCKETDSYGNCTKCIDGFYLYAKACYQGYIDNCVEYETEYLCKKCIDPWVIDHNTGNCILTEDCGIEGCTKCSIYSQCEECRKGYQLSEITKYCEKIPIENCEEYNSTDLTCNKCIDGYSFTNHKQTECKKCPDGCKDCLFDKTPTEICFNCLDGYVFNSFSNT